jgi:hypothetical protein
MEHNRREALLKDYGEVSSNFRTLTDVRFKMLGLLPIASGAAASLISAGSTPGFRFSLSLFGLAATIGIVTYNARNDQLYDELVGRAASIERSVGLPDGAFANRPRPWLCLRFGWIKWKVDHRTGVATIYAASIAIWLTALFYQLLELIGRPTYKYFERKGLTMPPFVVSEPALWMNACALGLALIVTYAGIKSTKRQRKRRQQTMRALARDAVNAAAAFKKAKTFDFSTAIKNDQFINTCTQLSGDKRAKILKRAEFLASLEPPSEEHFVPDAPPKHAAAHFVAVLTDLPPRWLFDCATNRRGDL